MKQCFEQTLHSAFIAFNSHPHWVPYNIPSFPRAIVNSFVLQLIPSGFNPHRWLHSCARLSIFSLFCFYHIVLADALSDLRKMYVASADGIAILWWFWQYFLSIICDKEIKKISLTAFKNYWSQCAWENRFCDAVFKTTKIKILIWIISWMKNQSGQRMV